MVNKTPDDNSYSNYIYNAFQFASDTSAQIYQNQGGLTGIATTVADIAINKVLWNIPSAVSGTYTSLQTYNKTEKQRMANAHFIRALKSDQQAKLEKGHIRDKRGVAHKLSPEVKSAAKERIQGLSTRLEELKQAKSDAQIELAQGVVKAVLPKEILALTETITEVFQSVQEGDHAGALSKAALTLAGENHIAAVSVKIMETIGRAYLENKGMSCENMKAVALHLATGVIKNETGVDLQELNETVNEKLEEGIDKILEDYA